MIGEMDLLTEGWERTAVLGWAKALSNSGANLCLALSPAVHTLLGELGEDIGFPGLAYMFQGWFLFYAVVYCPAGALKIARTPAEVSTDADILKESLNKLRINDFSRETHEKVFILECALANCNDGQGVGFCVMGVVIDTKMLTLIEFKLVTAATTLLPLMIGLSIFAGSHESPTGGGSVCELDDVQAATIRSVMLNRNATCNYNMTLDAILRGAP